MKTKQKRGISLVALIITIIVLIILTGAVIMSITGENSTIDKAKEAVFKSNLTNYREEYTRKVMQKQLDTNDTFDKNGLNIDGKTQYSELKKYVPSITDKDAENLGIVNGNLVYKNLLNDEEFEWATELGMTDLTSVALGKVKVGDYIKCTPGEGSYTSLASKRGVNNCEEYNMDSTAAKTDITYTTDSTSEEMWRVLSIKCGNVVITRGDPLLPKLILGGQTGYENVVEELNNICAIYKNAEYAKEARSIIIEDINEVTKFVPVINENLQSEDYGYQFEVDGKQYKSEHYSYRETVVEDNMTENEFNMIFKSTQNTDNNISYWIASTVFGNSMYGMGYTLYVRYIFGASYSQVSCAYMYDPNDGEYGPSNSVRPVVILKSTTAVTAANDNTQKGTSTNPWIIGNNE